MWIRTLLIANLLMAVHSKAFGSTINVVQIPAEYLYTISLENELNVTYRVGFARGGDLKESSDNMVADNEVSEGATGDNGQPDTSTISERVPMVLENGTRYECDLGGKADEGSADKIFQDKNIEEGREEGDLESADVQSIEEIIDSLSPWCAYRVEGWWTYEICHKNMTRQYHTSAEGTVETDILLGNYTKEHGSFQSPRSDDDWLAETNLFVSQLFVDGDPCDVAEYEGNKRHTEVRYSCGASRRPMLVDVQEPQSCSYIFDVRLSELCGHPALTRKTNKPERMIKCVREV